MSTTKKNKNELVKLISVVVATAKKFAVEEEREELDMANETEKARSIMNAAVSELNFFIKNNL
jgi:hypothetical protein